MSKFIHNRRFVIADFRFDDLQKTEDFLNTEYPNYAVVDVYYYYVCQVHRVRYTLQRVIDATVWATFVIPPTLADW